MATVDGRVLSEPSSSRLGRSWGVMMTMSAPIAHRTTQIGTRQTVGGSSRYSSRVLPPINRSGDVWWTARGAGRSPLDSTTVSPLNWDAEFEPAFNRWYSIFCCNRSIRGGQKEWTGIDKTPA